MSLQIVSVMNRIPSESYYFHDKFLASLYRHGVTPTILGYETPWGGLMTKPRTLRQWLKEGRCEASCLIVVDAWDLLFGAHPAAMEEQWEDIGKPWLIGGERNLFPAGKESAYPKCASTYRFPNSGFIISSPEDMLKVLEHMNLDSIPDDGVDPNNLNPNDQFYYQQAFLDQPIPMRIDTECQLVWNLCGVDLSNFDFTGELIRNRETDTFPCVFHFNGGAKDSPDGMRHKIMEHLKL